MNPFALTAGRAQDKFPDHHLDAVYPVCWPVYRIRLAVTVLEQSHISTTASYILRLVENGVREPAELRRMLGLQERYVVISAAELLSAGLVEQNQDRQLVLTGGGRRALGGNDEIALPRTEQIEIPFDPLTWRIPDIGVGRLVNQERVKERFAVQYAGSKPGPKDLRLEEVKQYANPPKRGGSPEKSIVGISEAGSRNARLQYRDDIVIVKLSRPDSGETVFLAYDDRHQRLEYETDSLQQLAERGISLVPGEIERDAPPWGDGLLEPAEVDLLEEIEQLDLKIDQAEHRDIRAGVDRPAQSPKRNDPTRRTSTKRQLVEKRAALEARLDGLTGGSVRLIRAEGHRGLLLDAIGQATEKLTLASAWIDPRVFDDEVCKRMELAVKRGVAVRIAWGLGENGRRTESERSKRKGQSAIKTLKEGIGDGAKELVINHTDVRKKFIICDDKFCVLSNFSWLSHHASTGRAYRGFGVYSTKLDVVNFCKEDADLLFQDMSAPS